MNRLTHERASGIRSGYWSPNKKQELVDALAEYENTGLTPEEIKKPSTFEFDFTGVESFDCQCGRHYVNMASGHAKHCEASAKWIPVEERLPENETDVEITFVRKHWKTGKNQYFTARAFYEDGTVNTEDSNYIWEDTDNWEFDEKRDAYIIPEGWWESVSFAEIFENIDDKVVAWKPLPEPYRKEHRHGKCDMNCESCPLEDTDECTGM